MSSKYLALHSANTDAMMQAYTHQKTIELVTSMEGADHITKITAISLTKEQALELAAILQAFANQ